MFAIVEVAGQQFKVQKDQNIFVHRLEEKEGQKIVLEKVLLVEDKGTALVGTPVVEGYQVKATVLAHVKGDKILVFKKKRRKGYQVLNGHRQAFTEIHIDTIEKGKATKKETEKKETATAKPASTTKKTASKTKETTKPAAKKTTAKAKTGEAGSTAKTTKPKASAAKKTTATSTKSTKTKAAAKPKATAAKTGTKKTVVKKDTGSKKEEK